MLPGMVIFKRTVSEVHMKVRALLFLCSDHDKTVKVLIDSGASVDSKDVIGWTPLDHAADKGNSTKIGLEIQSKFEFMYVNKHKALPYLFSSQVIMKR